MNPLPVSHQEVAPKMEPCLAPNLITRLGTSSVVWLGLASTGLASPWPRPGLVLAWPGLAQPHLARVGRLASYLAVWLPCVHAGEPFPRPHKGRKKLVLRRPRSGYRKWRVKSQPQNVPPLLGSILQVKMHGAILYCPQHAGRGRKT